jgi:hypothetical protein
LENLPEHSHSVSKQPLQAAIVGLDLLEGTSSWTMYESQLVARRGKAEEALPCRLEAADLSISTVEAWQGRILY